MEIQVWPGGIDVVKVQLGWMREFNLQYMNVQIFSQINEIEEKLY